MNKVYIVGPVASGKTTFAQGLSTKLNIPTYSLDVVMHEKDNSNKEWGNAPRTEKIRNRLFEDIMSKEKWIIEDAGRERFKQGFDEADTIIFLQTNLAIRKIRIITRYIKQKIHIEDCNYRPSIKMVKFMFISTKNFENGIDTLIMRLQPYNNKLVTLKGKKEIREFIFDIYCFS